VNIVLVEPVIPPNTGTIARLCAATETPLYLVGPLGFKIDDRHLKRAGLDYWPHVRVQCHDCWRSFHEKHMKKRFIFFSSRAEHSYTRVAYQEDDFLVFGNEVKGLPQDLRKNFADHFYTIPMQGKGVRSLNLANAVSIVLYEALRQLGRV
jgi:tRNA (cytidine/uridine-2'-O-)-methyltransferase